MKVKRKNEAVYQAAKQSGVFLWQVAKSLNLRDSEFSRKLREELPEDERDDILRVIEKISKAKREGEM